MKYFVKGLQAAIFSPGIDLTNKISFADLIVKETKDLFDGDPIILPLPADAPAEIPRIILKSKDQSYSLNVAQTRLDFQYNEQVIKDGLPTKEIMELKTSFLNHTSSLVDVFMNKVGAKVVRLGFIATFQTKPSENTNEFIGKKYLVKSYATGDLYNVALAILKRISLNKELVNIWFRLNSYRKEGDSLDNKVLTIQLDINTLSDVVLNLDSISVSGFFEKTISYLINNLDKYFDQKKVKK